MPSTIFTSTLVSQKSAASVDHLRMLMASRVESVARVLCMADWSAGRIVEGEESNEKRVVEVEATEEVSRKKIEDGELSVEARESRGELSSRCIETSSVSDWLPMRIASTARGSDAKPRRRATSGDWST